MNCLFAGNRAANHGGAIFAFGNKGLEAVNCTLAANAADSDGEGSGDGGGLTLDHDPGVAAPVLDVFSTIFWDNTDSGPQDGTAQISVLGGTATLEDCDVQGGWSGPGSDNINVDPAFLNAPGGVYRLTGGSPCIDEGDNGAIPADIADLDDDQDGLEPTPGDLDLAVRVSNNVVDMGCYECLQQCASCEPADVDCDGLVGITDLLDVLQQWGHFPDSGDFLPSACGDGNVGINEFLEVLAKWGTMCAGYTGSPDPPIDEAVEEAGLTEDDWDWFVDQMTDPTVSEDDKENYHCWMDHYLDCHRQPYCFECGTCQICPGQDPWNYPLH